MPVVAAAVIGAGASLYASSQANKAADKQIAAQQDATAQQVALQQQIYGNTVAANQPFTNAGYQGLDAYLTHIGLAPASGGSSTSAAVNTANADPYAEYKAANPDLAAEAARVVGRDPRFPTEASYFQWHDSQPQYASENRPSYTNKATTGTPEAPVTTGSETTQNGSTYGADLSSLGERPTYTRPYSVPLPNAPDLSGANYKASPGYDWQLTQGNRAINALSAARGLGQSSNALKEAMTYSQGLANQDYQQWVGNELNIWQTDINKAIAQNAIQNSNFESDRAYGTGVYDTNRNYLTNRYDTQTGNLLNLVNLGQSSANNTANAGQNYAANVGNAYQTNANVLSDAYGQKAANNSAAWNNIAGIGQNLLINGGFGGVKTTPIQTTSANDNVLQAAQPVYPQGNLLRAPYVTF